MSVRGFGMFAGGLKITGNSQGIIGPTSNFAQVNMRLYYWASDAMAPTTNLLRAGSLIGAACGITELTVIPLGQGNVFVNKYFHAAALMQTAPNSAVYTSSLGAYGNDVMGFIKPVQVNTPIIWTYANDAQTLSTAISSRAGDCAVLGDKTRALISGSTGGNQPSKQVDQYEYATTVVTFATDLQQTRVSASTTSVGNADMGIYTRGVTSGSTDPLITQKYAYASNTTSISARLPWTATQVTNSQSAGTDVAGILINGTTATPTAKYEYASDTYSTGAAMGPSGGVLRAVFVNNGLPGVTA